MAAGEFHDREEPRFPVDQCGDLAVVRADHQITFQVPGLAAVLRGLGALFDRPGIGDLRAPLPLHRVSLVLPDRAAGAKAFADLAWDHFPSGGVDRPVDRLVADLHRRVIAVIATKVADYLLG